MTSVVLPATSRPATRNRSIAAPLRRFRPRLALGYQDKLYRLVRQLKKMHHDEADRELSLTIQAEEHRRSQYETLGLTLEDIVPTLHWTTALRVLRDLHVQGWTFRTDDEGLLLKAPGTAPSSDPEVEKEAIRRSFAFAPQRPNSHSRAPYASSAGLSVAEFTPSSPTARNLRHGSGLVDGRASSPNLNWSSTELGIPARDCCSKTSGDTYATSGRSRTRARPAETCTTSSVTARLRAGRSSASRRSAIPCWVSLSATITRAGVPRDCVHAGPS